MTLEFINKRIAEQDEYIRQQWKVCLKGDISLDRYAIIASSACAQWEYLTGEKQKLLEKIATNSG